MNLHFSMLIFLSVVAVSQDESEDQSTARKLEWSGNFDVKYSIFHMNQSSANYKLQFFNKSISSYLSQYRIEPYVNAEYKLQNLEVQLKTHAIFYDEKESSFDLYEAYGTYNPSASLSLQAGKRVYNWGKGYAFNPVGFVNTVKDPENPELAQAGLMSINAEFVKSFPSEVLQSFSVMMVILSGRPVISHRFDETKNTDVGLKFSFLVMDTDIDFMTYQSVTYPARYGVDFSRNIMENLEVHAELSVANKVIRYVVANGVPQSQQSDRASYLFGFRYLSEISTTVIAEYYHNGSGLSRSEFQSYHDYLVNGLSIGTSVSVQRTMENNRALFNSNTLMQEYLYVKISHPEPFDLLYVTPSMFSIYNLADKSVLLSASIQYKPTTDLEFILWPSFLVGSNNSEFGGRQAQQRIDLWMRVFF